MNIVKLTILLSLLILGVACSQKSTTEKEHSQEELMLKEDSLQAEVSKPIEILPENIALKKVLLYDQYTLEDIYPYKDTTRVFQWKKMQTELARLENLQMQQDSIPWCVLQNKQNKNGEAPLIRKYNRNAYRRVADSLGVERFQSVPLFLLNDTLTPELYGRDGTLAILLGELGTFWHVRHVSYENEWLIPKKYVKPIEAGAFSRVAVVDRTNQNIATLEKDSVLTSSWIIRSMNPATTGLRRPPYQLETPLGVFVVQDKKEKMYFLVDGTSDIGGFSPWASRFCNGGYIHGVPVNLPRKTIIEYSNSLGTTPRSHMCVRNASSHAKFVYDWALPEKSLVVVIE